MSILIFYFFSFYIFIHILQNYIYQNINLPLNDHLYLLILLLIFVLVFIFRKKLIIKFECKEIFLKKKFINYFLIFIFINSLFFFTNDFSSSRYEIIEYKYVYFYFELIITLKFFLSFYLLFLSNYEIKYKHQLIMIISFILFNNGLQSSISTIFLILTFFLKKYDFNLKNFIINFNKKNLFLITFIILTIPFIFILGLISKNDLKINKKYLLDNKNYLSIEYLIPRISSAYNTMINNINNDYRYFKGNINSTLNKRILNSHQSNNHINQFNLLNSYTMEDSSKLEILYKKSGASPGFVGSLLVLFDKEVSVFLFLFFLILYLNVIENIFLGSNYSLKNIIVVISSYNLIFRGYMNPVDLLHFFDATFVGFFILLILSTTRFIVKD